MLPVSHSFTGYDYQEKDKRMPEAAYWASYAGYKMQDAVKTLKYFDWAVKDEERAKFVMQYACEAYNWQKDEQAYLIMLKRGFDDYPDFLTSSLDWLITIIRKSVRTLHCIMRRRHWRSTRMVKYSFLPSRLPY